MKKTPLYFIICLVFFCSLVFTGCPESSHPQTPEMISNLTPTQTAEPIPESSEVTGAWDLSFDWGCDGSSSEAQWMIAADGTFKDTTGENGTWELIENLMILTYSDGNSVFTGTVNNEGTEMTGTMEYPNRLYGCWDATKVTQKCENN